MVRINLFRNLAPIFFFVVLLLSMNIFQVAAVSLPPTVYSCDSMGFVKDGFDPAEIVYACGDDYEPEEFVTVYVTRHGGPYVSIHSLCGEAAQADSSGHLGPVALGTFPEGEYDIWVDRGVQDGWLRYHPTSPMHEPVDTFGNCVEGFSVVSELCEVTFLTDPVCSSYSITFEGETYHNGTVDMFVYGTSGLATANCPAGWVFDHWEVTGNVEVADLDVNPTTVTVTCGGTLKAVFSDPVDPVACFNRTPGDSYTGQTVVFDASSSYDPDGFIVSYSWNFGDGNITTVRNPVIVHRYVSTGTYNVTLTVTDNDGLEDFAKNHLTIRALAGDLNGDLIVNILDMAAVAKAFGFNPQNPDWNTMLDLDNNGVINIIDIAIVANEYGKTAQ